MRAALAFLTPLGGARDPSPGALPWFPVVGALVGLGVGGTWWVGSEVWNPMVGAALAVVADLALTGMLHIDGLGDSADGLLPHLSRERRLEVMTEPDIGAFGVGAIGAALVLQVSVLTSLAPDVVLVAATWGTTRAAAAITLLSMPYARPGGLAQSFRGRSPVAVAVAAATFIALSAIEPYAVVGVVAGFGAVALVARRRIGGYTGDVLGAGIVAGQVAALLGAAA